MRWILRLYHQVVKAYSDNSVHTFKALTAVDTAREAIPRLNRQQEMKRAIAEKERAAEQERRRQEALLQAERRRRETQYETIRSQAKPVDADETTVDDALAKCSVVFKGSYTKEQISARLFRAMDLYDAPRYKAENAASVVVALRENTGIAEMVILDYMIRSYVPGVRQSFSEAAALAATFLQAGDR